MGCSAPLTLYLSDTGKKFTMLCRLVPATPSLLPAAAARHLGTAATVVDQMIAYARKEGGSAAVDVVRSGLAMQPDPGAGADASRLLLAMSELSTAQSDWASAASSASKAIAAASAGAADQQQSLALSGLLLQVRALLAAGDDSAAAAAAAAALPGPAAAVHPLQSALQLLVRTASGGEASSATSPAHALAGSSGQPADVLEAVAAKLSGDALLLQGQGNGATDAYRQALSSAEAAAVAAEAGGNACTLAKSTAQEVAADASLGLAQASIAAKQWDQAEERLSAALKAAEAAGGETAPLLSPVLALLGVVYSRSARVMYAEGMFREAAKLSRLDPSRLSVVPPLPALHPSLHATLAWRHCQLLHALPNRGSEASSWEACARDLWGRSAALASGPGPEAVLGDLVALKGQGQHGGRCVVSLLPRRLLVGGA